MIPMDATKHLEQKLNQLAITLCPPTEPIGNTLCTTQKKTSLDKQQLSTNCCTECIK